MLDEGSLGAVMLPGASAAVGFLPPLGASLEAAGFESVWAGEVNNLEAPTQLALVGSATASIGLAAVLSVYTRAPTTLALTASTLGKAFPGRVSIALGASSPLLVETWNGIPYGRPLARVRDVLRFLRMALEGRRVDEAFATFSSRGFRLVDPAPEPPRLEVATVSPGTLRLAAKEADGVVLNWCSPADIDGVEADYPDRTRISTCVYVCPTSDAAQARALMGSLVADYLSVPAYAEFQRRMGRGPALEPMWVEQAKGNRNGALAKLPAAVFDDLVVHGPPAECRARVADYRAAGVTPVLNLVTDVAPFEDQALALADG